MLSHQGQIVLACIVFGHIVLACIVFGHAVGVDRVIIRACL